MKACQPLAEGVVVRDGVEIHYERYGQGTPAIVLLPTWSLVTSRHWKMQIPYLSRHFTVLCFDGRGNGRSGRPAQPAAYTDVEFAADSLAVMEANAVEKAVLVSVSAGARWGLRLCAEHSDHALGSLFIAPSVGLAPRPLARQVQRFEDVIDEPVGWERYNAHHWQTDYSDFVTFFIEQILTEAHSTKQIEDAVGWALETDGPTLVATHRGLARCDEATVRGLAAKVACPVLVVHGTDDALHSLAEAAALADCTGGSLVALGGCGHFPHARDPVRINLLIKEFVDRISR
jgi:pimeloyl-ACP methyl ester carboxylesterase